ncbi:MAG: LysR family transcriptional regulator [Butyricicoccus sp.]|nr:LysR family transcriptional regulator [Butyricicoccus sp.]
MKIEHLYYLKEIARCKSISAAAKRLYIGQTTLSAIIKSLEEEIGVPIFRRISSGVLLTTEGKRIMELSEEILEKYSEMITSFRDGDALVRRIHFLVDTTMCRYFSVHLTMMLQEADEQSCIVFHETDRRKLLPLLLDGVANIGVTSMDSSVEIGGFQEQAERNGVETVCLGDDKFYLCVRTQHERFGHRTSVDVNELLEERFAAPQHYSSVPNGTVFSEVFRKLNCVAVFPTPELVKEAVAESNMFTILSGRALVNDPYILMGTLVAIPLTGFSVPNSTGIYMFSRKRSTLNYFEKIVYDTLIDYRGNILAPAAHDEPYPPITSFKWR